MKMADLIASAVVVVVGWGMVAWFFWEALK